MVMKITSQGSSKQTFMPMPSIHKIIRYGKLNIAQFVFSSRRTSLNRRMAALVTAMQSAARSQKPLLRFSGLTQNRLITNICMKKEK